MSAGLPLMIAVLPPILAGGVPPLTLVVAVHAERPSKQTHVADGSLITRMLVSKTLTIRVKIEGLEGEVLLLPLPVSWILYVRVGVRVRVRVRPKHCPSVLPSKVGHIHKLCYKITSYDWSKETGGRVLLHTPIHLRYEKLGFSTLAQFCLEDAIFSLVGDVLL